MEIDFYELSLGAKGVEVSYSVLDDRGKADVTQTVSKKNLIAYIEENKLNRTDDDAVMDAQTYFNDNWYGLTQNYITDAVQ